MKDEKELGLERDDDTLAEAAEPGHPFAFCIANRRIDRAQEEWAREPDPLERLLEDSWFQVLEVDRDVRVLGQGAAFLPRVEPVMLRTR